VFDAAVAWGVMFHLTPEDAIRAIANVSRTLKRDAPFLFTSGDADGFEAKQGQMNGVTFGISPTAFRTTDASSAITASHWLTSTLTAVITPTTWQGKTELLSWLLQNRLSDNVG
jgi:hypothetical protein